MAVLATMDKRLAGRTRQESDAMGIVSVPAAVYWGAQTQRAVANFSVSGQTLPVELIRCLGLIKLCAVETNAELGLVEKRLAKAIGLAAEEVFAGRHDGQFPVDVFQTGSGTSSHMNANEVIANRANEILGKPKGKRWPVHPNDHVNRGQSSNDVFPTAIHIAAALALKNELIPALRKLHKALLAASRKFRDVVKTGRTHLQDAVPMSLGAEFGAFAAQIGDAMQRIEVAVDELCALPLGGTAVGSGLNAHPQFARKTIARLKKRTKLKLRQTANLYAGVAARETLVSASGTLNAAAVALAKIGNDLRLLASGPRAGLGEIKLPALQQGSSMMPGKINPVIPEVVVQVAVQAMGNHVAVTVGSLLGNLQLNVTMPMLARNVLESARLLTAASSLLADKCVSGIEADRKHAESFVENSLTMVTSLAPVVGYDKAADIAHAAYASGRTLRDTARDMTNLSEKDLTNLLDPRTMLDAAPRRATSGTRGKTPDQDKALSRWTNEGGH